MGKVGLCLLALVSAALAEPPVELFQSAPLVQYVNSIQTTWKAGVNEYFENAPMHGVRRMMGALDDTHLRNKAPRHYNFELSSEAIPDSFDARTAWPKCADVIGNIRDQSSCGSCWAMGAVGAMSDRICIKSDGQQKPSISGDDLMSCCWECGYGCNGGYPLMAWEYWVSHGICTGGPYGSAKGCKPYPLPMCEHHINATHHPPCPKQEYDTPPCTKTCNNTHYDTPYATDKGSHKGSKAYGVHDSVEAIQKEIMTYGPVEAAFSVYKDFLTYKSGVYKHESGGMLGGHAVRMLGWGVDNGTPYWLIANSWNADWGDKGYFKILRGSNECGIESGIVAGQIK